LVKTSAGNGNLLFNVGPMMDGRIEARQLQRLKEMGEWLEKYGSSIYGTKGGPYKPNDLFAATRKGEKIYLHIFKKNGNVLELPSLPNTLIRKAYFMNGSSVVYKQDNTGTIKIDLPDVLPDANSSVIVLELDKNTEDIPVVD
jgi:alpha-L-fucosidase